ncbi:MAG: TolC family protein [Acidobacteriota bacterium]|jgi:outer membrane protein TolC|nr:TolC family protein [Acidobacteriota bacterium]
MRRSPFRSALLAAALLPGLLFPPTMSAQSGGRGFSLGDALDAWRPNAVAAPELENSPRIESLVRDGRLELSLADALALALENNLDIAVQRFIPEYSQTDLLRSKAGQSPRGFTGGSTPGGLTSGAMGAGISGSGSGSGVGSAGGITGGGGSVQVGSSGNFDPTLSVSFSYDRVTSPLNSTVVSGVPTVTGDTTAFSASYAQLFSLGTSYSLTLSGQQSSSTQQNLLFNPSSVTRFALGVNQPLLNGFGRLPNERYIMVARNNTAVAENVFKLQLITTVTAVENAYWELAALGENVRVAEQSLAVARQLLEDNKIRLDVGTMSPLEVTSAESEVAARLRDLTVAQTNLQFQEASLKNMLVRKITPDLEAVRVVLRDAMPRPGEADIPDAQEALEDALKNRPELQTADINLKNQDISVQFTKNALKPALSVFGFYAGSGLKGDSLAEKSGLAGSFGQSFKGTYPEYAGGFSLSVSLRNRTAQADSLRAQLEQSQQLISRQKSQNSIAVEVQKAIIGLIQGKAQVEAAHKAATLAKEIWEGEKVKLDAGASTSYQVILRERDFVSAQQAEVAASVAYAKAMVELDRARGVTLERNSVKYDEALGGAPPSAPATRPSDRREEGR